MADDVIKRLLIKLGIDGSEATAFISKLQDALDRLAATEKAKATERKTAQQDDITAMAKQAELAKQQTAISSQQVANLRQQIEAKQTTVKEIQKEIAQEKAKLDVRQATLKIMASEGALSAEALKNMEKQIALERQRLVLQQAQLRATGAGAAGGRSAEGTGIFGIGGVLRGAARGLLGGGGVGTIAAGLFGGVAVVEGVQLLMEEVRELAKALAEATGPAQTLRIEFEKLAKDKGVDPAGLLQRMREATHGLVADSQLFQVSTSFMRQGMKMTTEQMTQLVKNTVDLAAASGNSAPEALNALTRAFQTGKPFMLAHVTGLTQMDLKMQAMPRNIDPVIAKTLQFTQFLKAENDAMNKIVIPAATLPDLFTQLHVAQKNFIDGVGEGILSTGNFGKSIQDLSKYLISLLPKIVEMGKKLGEDLANGLKWLIAHWPEIKTGLETIVAIKLADWAAGGAVKIFELAKALTTLNKITSGLTLGTALEKAGLSGIAGLAGAIRKPATTVAERAAIGAGGGETIAGVAGVAGAGAVVEILVPIAVGVLSALGIKWVLDWLKSHPQTTTGIGGAIGKELTWTGEHGELKAAQDIKDAGKFFSETVKDAGKAIANFIKGSTEDVQSIGADFLWGLMGGKPAPTGMPKNVPLVPSLNLPPGMMGPLTPMQQLATAHTPGYKPPGAESVDNVALMEEQKKLAALKSNIAREQAKLEYQIAKEEADAELELLKNKYQRGLMSMEQYVAQEKVIRDQEYQAQVAEIAAERKAEHTAVTQKHAEDKDLNPEARKEAREAERLEQKAVDAKFDLADEQAHAAHLKVIAAMDEKAAADHAAAEKTYQQEVIKLKKEGIAEQEKLLEGRFKQGAVGPDSYIEQRKAMIQQELALVTAELDEELKDRTKTEEQIAQITIQKMNEVQTAQKQITDLDQQQEQIRVQAIENYYARIKANLEEQQAAAQLGVQQRVPGARGSEIVILQEMSDKNREQIALLTARLALEANEPQLWAQTLNKIKQATDQQIKLNQQLAAAKDIAGPLAGLMGSIAGALGAAGMTRAEQVLKSMQQSLDAMSKLFQQPGFFGKQKPISLAPTAPGSASGLGALTGGKGKEEAARDLYVKTLTSNIDQLKAAAAGEAKTRADASAKLAKDLEAIGADYKGVADKVRALGDAAATAAMKISGGKMPGQQGPESEAPPPMPTLSPTGTGPILGGGGLSVAPMTNTAPVMVGTAGASTGTSSGSSAQSGNVITEFVQALQDGKGNVTSALKGLVGALSSAISSIGNFIGAMRNASSGAGGALSGGMSGMAMGGQIGSMIPLPMAGPIGAAIGGVGGAIMGGIFGSKENQMKKDVKLLQDQLQNIVDQLHDGTISIGQAIANLRQERQTAISMLSGGKGSKSKKGAPSQLQSVLAQIDSQLAQILQEQQQLFDQMDESILSMSQGIYWQPLINQLDQIVKQYQQFASAADGNVQQVAAANEYLTQSLQNYSTTMQNTMLSDQEQAIQNALQLLQLEQQQVMMTNQYQQSVYGILSQGVTARQVSGAQTKGAEIEALNQQYSQQQQQMQAEISVADYKFQIQQKIFGLASSQVGLEMELVAVQDAQANNSLQSVLVMQQAIQAINEALATGNLPGLLTGTLSTGGQGLAGILQLLGLTVPNVPGLGAGGGGNYLTEITGAGSQFQGLIASMNAQDPNFLLDVIQAMITAPGSAQRQALVSLVNNPQYGLGTSAVATYGSPFLQEFLNWINTGASIAANSPLPPSQPGGYQEGTTYVPQTGIAQLEQGEAVIPAGMNPWSGVDASGGAPFGAGLSQSISATAGAAVNDANLQVEQQITNLVMSRISAEWLLVNAKMQLLQMEQQSQSGTPSGVASFEGGLAKVYELRGRYGSGGVRTEYL